MDTVTDDLNRPLGLAQPPSKPELPRLLLPAAGILSGLLVAGVVGYVSFLGDPLGGVPHARVDIVARPAPPAEAPPALPPTPGAPAAPPDRARQSAGEVETASGVSVLRPGGARAPEALIIRVPDEASLGLKPAPDPRLVDRTRFGALPRIGPDGARPLDVYARPVGALATGAAPAARVAVVVGGMGISHSTTLGALGRLPPPVTLAFAPYGQELDRLAARAREAGHELILQVPMEPFDYPDSDPGPHTLTAASRPADNIEHLHWAMGRFTGYVGLMNYMGGKLTAEERALSPILREIGSRGLGFLDDGSSSRSVATAFKGETPVARADIVLDASGRAEGIDKALEKLEATARSGGRIALGTASALPLSIERIERWARGLEARGVLLVPASAALRSAPRESASR